MGINKENENIVNLRSEIADLYGDTNMPYHIATAESLGNFIKDDADGFEILFLNGIHLKGIYPDGNLTNPIIHCESGPAVIFPNGDYEYWIMGCFHRDNGPARFVKCRTENYLHNYLHNPLGPAVIEPDGTQLYYLYGFKVSKENLGTVQIAAEMVQNKEILE